MVWSKCKLVQLGGGGQGGCEPKIELIVRMQKKVAGWGVRVDVNQKLKLL